MRFNIVNNHVSVAENTDNFFITSDRRFQRFLYENGVQFNISYRDEFNMTYWAYIRTDDVNRLIRDFKSMPTESKNAYIAKP